jgi:RloB-like protein
MARQRRGFVRRGGFRDAVLFVIASEGALTEPRYFRGLKERWHHPGIHIHVLERVDPSLSSPEHVLGELDRFRGEYSLQERDQLWLLMDRDFQSWKPAMISAIAQECQSKGYFLAASNPCFEIWLLLHFEDVPNQADPRKQEWAANADGLLKSEVARHCSASCPYIDNFIPHTEKAIARAEALDIEPETRWPSQLGTRVHRLVKQLAPVSS